MKKILFVCLGNICRSPSAEGVMKAFLKKNNLDSKVKVDSCGTSSNHEGEQSDIRSRTHAKKRGYTLDSLARGFRSPEDFENFDYIITMDDSNYSNVVAMDTTGEYKDKVMKMTDFCEKSEVSSVPDPYYEGPHGFETVLDLLEDACKGLLKKVETEI